MAFALYPWISAATTGGSLAFAIAEKNKRTFRLRNDTNHDMIIECMKKGNNAGKRVVHPGEWYTVDIQPHVRTHWWCNIWFTVDSNEFTTFVIHNGHEKSHSFHLTNEGIYKMDLNGSHHHFFKQWNGR